MESASSDGSESSFPKIVIPRGLEERSLALAGDIAENLNQLAKKLN